MDGMPVNNSYLHHNVLLPKFSMWRYWFEEGWRDCLLGYVEKRYDGFEDYDDGWDACARFINEQ